MVKHSCIKCKAQYEDEELDDYYCPPCNELKKSIAKEIDAKFVGRKPKRPVVSDLKLFEQEGRTIPSAHGGLATFVKVKL